MLCLILPSDEYDDYTVPSRADYAEFWEHILFAVLVAGLIWAVA
jgi:hypothetical protein